MVGNHLNRRMAEASLQERREPNGETGDMPDLVEITEEDQDDSGERRQRIDYAPKAHYRVVYTEMPEEAARALLPEGLFSEVQTRLHESNIVESTGQETTEPRSTDDTTQS